jgi:hypothetical protein
LPTSKLFRLDCEVIGIGRCGGDGIGVLAPFIEDAFRVGRWEADKVGLMEDGGVLEL